MRGNKKFQSKISIQHKLSNPDQNTGQQGISLSLINSVYSQRQQASHNSYDFRRKIISEYLKKNIKRNSERQRANSIQSHPEQIKEHLKISILTTKTQPIERKCSIQEDRLSPSKSNLLKEKEELESHRNSRKYKVGVIDLNKNMYFRPMSLSESERKKTPLTQFQKGVMKNLRLKEEITLKNKITIYQMNQLKKFMERHKTISKKTLAQIINKKNTQQSQNTFKRSKTCTSSKGNTLYIG